MKYTIICKTGELPDPFSGTVIPAREKTFELPYEFFQEVWYVCRKGKKYQVIHDRIASCWCTNGIVGYKLDYSKWSVGDYQFDRLFDNKNDAIDLCLKLNERVKVKIKDYV